MQVNKVAESVHPATVRSVVEGFREDRLGGVALRMKRGDSYWELTYGETREWVRSLGAALLERGVKAGDRVGVISENRSEWVLAYLAVACVGAVVVPYDILLKVDELTAIVRASGARLLFTSAEYLDKVGKAAADAVDTVVLFDPPPAASALPLASFTELVESGRRLRAEGRDAYRSVSVKPEDLCELIFTSGTMGVPKGVMLSHRNIVQNADGIQMTTALGPADNWVIVLPFHHTYPTMMGIFTPLLTYGQITSVPSMKTPVLIGIMRDTAPTSVPAMPLLIEKLYKGILTEVRAKPPLVRALFAVMHRFSSFCVRVLHLRIGKVLFKSVVAQLGLQKLRFFISGGGPISKDVIDGMDALGMGTYQGYGLTEASPVVSSNCPVHNTQGSVGLPLCNLEVRMESPDSNGNGEILVRGPNVMMGYYNMPRETAEVLDADGWLRTGDIGRLDRNGYLYITGRLKNVIVTKGGKNIYPEEIENLLTASPLLAEVIVVGNRAPDGGEEPHAIIHPDPDVLAVMAKEKGVASFSDEEVRAIVRAEMQRCCAGAAGYKVPHSFEVSVEELPKTSTRKVKRFMFAPAERGRRVASPPSRQ
jgi:long-chain acyl-CoA synthetase